MKKVQLLKRQNAKWEIIEEYTFKKRMYEVDEMGNFYRNGIKVINKPDKNNTITISLLNDSGFGVRFKLHQIILQTFEPYGLEDRKSIDHKNRNRLDNRLTNLRYASSELQAKNRENVAYKLKKVICVQTKQVFMSCQEAEQIMALPKNTVARVARGERHSTRGYVFEWI